MCAVQSQALSTKRYIPTIRSLSTKNSVSDNFECQSKDSISLRITQQPSPATENSKRVHNAYPRIFVCAQCVLELFRHTFHFLVVRCPRLLETLAQRGFLLGGHCVGVAKFGWQLLASFRLQVIHIHASVTWESINWRIKYSTDSSQLHDVFRTNSAQSNAESKVKASSKQTQTKSENETKTKMKKAHWNNAHLETQMTCWEENNMFNIRKNTSVWYICVVISANYLNCLQSNFSTVKPLRGTWMGKLGIENCSQKRLHTHSLQMAAECSTTKFEHSAFGLEHEHAARFIYTTCSPPIGRECNAQIRADAANQ